MRFNASRKWPIVPDLFLFYLVCCLSIYPETHDAGWKIITDTYVLPWLWWKWRVDIVAVLPIRWKSIEISHTHVHDPDVKSPSSYPVIKDWTSVLIFHPHEKCYGMPGVQTSVIGYLDVTGRASRETIRALCTPVRAWFKMYIAWYSRRIFVGADITCPVSAIEWVQGNRNWEVL